ncbi:hypothetical protein [Saccharibacillus qingshengii]|uniref:hypothetical protein n=1 Tax=Saccharibacillus qingshengii TaxID=1763540 RepID=UPI001554014B|nr:hypothetical protein [Saccharibacillus qingshengii]
MEHKDYNRKTESSSKEYADSSPEELRKAFEKFVSEKNPDTEAFGEYLRNLNPSMTSLFEALKSFSETHKFASENTTRLFEQVLEIFKEELNRDLSFEQRKEIYNRIEFVLQKIAEESHENREHNKTISKYAIGAAVVLLGGTIAIATKGKSTALLEKGTNFFTNKS